MTTAAITFSPFADAAMAALASRSHEWVEWEIREHDDTLYQVESSGRNGVEPLTESHASALDLTVRVPTDTPKQIGEARLHLDPRAESPWESVVRALAEAPRGLRPHVALANWRSASTLRQAAPVDRELVTRSGAYLEELARDLLRKAPTLRLEGLLRQVRVRNSRGLTAAFAETEIRLKSGAATIFQGIAYDPKIVEERLRKI